MKHLIHRILLFFVVFISLISCSGNEDPVISLSVSRYNVAATGGTQILNVQANVDYEVIIDNSCKDWISVLSTRAMQDSKITLQISKNEEIVERSGKVVLKYKDISQEVIITQQAALPSISVSQDKLNVECAGGTQVLNVQANVDYEVIIDDSCKDWVSVLSTRAMQDSKVTLQIYENEEIVERSGRVVLKYKDISQEIVVTQQAALPSIFVSQNQFDIECEGETIMIDIKSNVEYNIDLSQNDWIEIGEAESNSLSCKYFIISKNENFDGRTGDIIVYNSQYNLKEIIQISQKQKDTIITDGDISIGALGGTLIQNVKSNVDYSVKYDAEWVNLRQTRSLSKYVLEFDIDKNSDNNPRSTVITITNGIIEESFTITQDGATPGSSNIEIIPIIKL